MSRFPFPKKNTRIGFHYFPDTDHYRNTNLNTWLPELNALGTSWLSLKATSDRAIPEHFLRGLLDHNIEPILLIDLPIENPFSPSDLELLFSIYARWGIRYIRIFDRPNNRSSWSPPSWMQANLVERFLDRYLPYALSALHAGLSPIFPTLEPGGDYWDTAFLRDSLISIRRRGYQKLLDHLVFGAYANAGHRSITWGKGGKERWPQTKPYTSPSRAEDHQGFYIFEWYIPIIESVIEGPASIILFEAGAPLESFDSDSSSILDLGDHKLRNLALINAVASSDSYDPNHLESDNTITVLDPIPTQVISCNFWLLTASPNSPHVTNAWFKPDGTTLPVVEAVNNYFARMLRREETKKVSKNSDSDIPEHTISHYLLLPSDEWGVTDWHLDFIKPFVKQYKPTIGFSLIEASKATRVSIVGGVQAFNQEDLDFLKASGCVIDRISRDGTSIATND